MASVLDRHRDAQHGVVTASVAASLLIHGSLIALAWVYVDGSSSWTSARANHAGNAQVVEPSEPLYLVLETEAPQPTHTEPALAVVHGGAQQQLAAAPGPGDAAPTGGYATAASDANDMDAALGLPGIERRAAPSAQGLLVETRDLGKVVAVADIHATVRDSTAGAVEDEKDKDGEGGLKGVLKGIGGFLDGIKVSGVGGAGGVAGAGRGPGKGGCVPGIGGIIGGRGRQGGTTSPQRPAVGPPGIGGPRGPGFEHNSGPRRESCD